MQFYTIFKSPVGDLCLVSDGNFLIRILFPGQFEEKIRLPNLLEKRDANPLPEAYRQLGEFFRGNRMNFDLPLSLHGTVFQLKVWEALQRIPFASTVTYKEVARQIGNLKSVRAVGQAVGRNPIPIVIPCHRVVGADGSLTGYGGGLNVKKALLDYEHAIATQQPLKFGLR